MLSLFLSILISITRTTRFEWVSVWYFIQEQLITEYVHSNWHRQNNGMQEESLLIIIGIKIDASPHLWPMTKRTMIPFSSSIFRRLSPVVHFLIIIRYWSRKETWPQQNYLWARTRQKKQTVYIPRGTHVERTESLLFLLLNAVFIPITIRYFRFLKESPFSAVSDTGDPARIASCAAFAAANSISKLEIVLSNVLYQMNWSY